MQIDMNRWTQLRDARVAPWISPSLLAADMTRIGDAVKAVAEEADLIHFDVMDGVFVPNISFGLPVLQAIDRLDVLPCDVHLMIQDAERYIDAFADAGARIITVHVEATPHLHRTIQRIHSRGLLAGVTLNPGTPIHALDAVLGDVDLVLVMSVNPGFGGQSFIPATVDRLLELRSRCEGLEARPLIQVDGGVSVANASSITEAGADILVAGSSVFGAADPVEAVRQLREAAALGQQRWLERQA